MSNPADHDDLIARLQARAADPARRTDIRPSVFEAGISSMSLGGMLSMGRSLAGGLMRVVQSNQAGRMPDQESMDLANRLSNEMQTPAPVPALRTASIEGVRGAEQALGLTFPSLLTRAYVEIGDGGFGPSGGLLSIKDLVRETRSLQAGDPLPRNRVWPRELLPLVDRDPGWWCVNVTTEAIIEWDPEDLEERSSEARFTRSFTDASPSLYAWLDKWARRKTAADRNKPSQEERWARMAERAQRPGAIAWQEAKTRKYLEQISPEDRKKWGFDDLYPDIGRGDSPGHKAADT